MAKHIHIYLNKTKDEKEKTPQDIIDYMVKHGNNKIDAEKLVKKHFNYVVKQYSNSPVSKMAEVIGYLSMHDKKSKDGSAPSKEDVEKFAPQAPASLKSHKMWNKNDYAYFRGKGYSDSEIKKLWDRDSKTGTNPVTWNMDKKSKDATYFRLDDKQAQSDLWEVGQAIKSIQSTVNAGNDVKPQDFDRLISTLQKVRQRITKHG